MHILCGGSKSVLIIEGENVEEIELCKAWDEIQEECTDLIKSERSNTIFEAWKKFEYTNFKILYVENALPYLKRKWDKDMAERLVSLGFDYLEEEGDDREAYMKKVYAIETEAKILVVQLNQYFKAYHALLPPRDDGQERRLEIEYETELAILSKDAGYRIDKRTTTVFEYFAIVNAFLETNKIKRHGAATV